MSTETQRRTVTVETENSTTQKLADRQRLAWNDDGAVSMTLRVGPNSIWFDKETSPAGVRLSTDASEGDTPSWPIDGGGMRPPAESKLAALLRNGWELVDNDVGLGR
jgi:hypothetical protein